MDKRADLMDFVLSPTFATVVVMVMVLGYFLYFAFTLPGDLSFEKNFLAADTGLILDALPVFPGNIYLFYNTQPTTFKRELSFHFDKNHAYVFEDESLEKDPRRASKLYYQDKSFSYSTPKTILAKEGSIIRFAKEANKISVSPASELGKTNLYVMHCPEADLSRIKGVALDPAHAAGENNEGAGYISEGTLESYFNREVASQLQARLQGFAVTSTRTLEPPVLTGVQSGLEDDVPVQKRITIVESADFFISLHAIDAPANENVIKAFYNIENDAEAVSSSISIACRAVNSLSAAFAEKGVLLTGASIVPVSPNALPDDHFDILKAKKAGILVEMGNLRVIKGKQVLVAEALKHAFTA